MHQGAYEPLFSESSWGFRPGRQAHDAVRAAQVFAREGKDWVVDFDLEKFFDRVNHEILMTRIGQTIRDKRVLKLIGRFLRSGVMINGVVTETGEAPRRSRFPPCCPISTWTRWIGNWRDGATVSAATRMTEHSCGQSTASNSGRKV
jgi:retron-type reverse transcriptase